MSLGGQNGSRETNQTTVIARVSVESGWTRVGKEELEKVKGGVFGRFCKSGRADGSDMGSEGKREIKDNFLTCD